jgi:hypothetical protein
MDYNFKAMTIDQLLIVNKEICDIIRIKRSAEAAVKVTQFSVGDKVRYAGSAKTAPFNATVTKVLRVNVDVITEQGRPWRINASLLSHIRKD